VTPAEHITKAERLLSQAQNTEAEDWDTFATATATEAIGHALIAIAIELGAPHTVTAPVTSSGT
jgi:hypothetical protein